MPARKRTHSWRTDIEYDDGPGRPAEGTEGDGDSPAELTARVQQELDKRRAAGETLTVILPQRARDLSVTFWGKAWNLNLMAYSDYASRMPRGRSCFRSGRVMNLAVEQGLISALVAGTRLYEVAIRIQPLAGPRWASLRERCHGRIGGLVELLSGDLSDEVMREVTGPGTGLFPKPEEIRMHCSCPDDADLCKHSAAVLYAMGSRLDDQPGLLFVLRGVDPQELIAAGVAEAIARLTAPADRDVHDPHRTAIPEADWNDLFGIDMDTLDAHTAQPPAAAPPENDGPAREP